VCLKSNDLSGIPGSCIYGYVLKFICIIIPNILYFIKVHSQFDFLKNYNIFLFDIFLLSPSKFSLCGCTLRFVFVVFINCSISFNWWWHLQMHKVELLWDRYEILAQVCGNRRENQRDKETDLFLSFWAAFLSSLRYSVIFGDQPQHIGHL